MILFDNVGRAISCGDPADRVEINHEHHEMGGVKLADPLDDLAGRYDETALQRHLSKEDRRGVTGDEYEQVGGAAESEISKSQQVDDIVRDVIEQKEPDGDPAHEIDPLVVPVRREIGLG